MSGGIWTHVTAAGPPSRRGVLNVVAIEEHIPMILEDEGRAR